MPIMSDKSPVEAGDQAVSEYRCDDCGAIHLVAFAGQSETLYTGCSCSREQSLAFSTKHTKVRPHDLPARIHEEGEGQA